MTLEELADSLPNGFHDSKCKLLTVDFERRTICMQMSLLVGLPDDPPKHRDDYRDAQVEVSGFSLFVVEQPDGTKDIASPGAVFIVDAYETQSIAEVSEGLKRLMKSTHTHFLHSFFVHDWNSFIHIGARDCSVRWVDPVVGDKAQ